MALARWTTCSRDVVGQHGRALEDHPARLLSWHVEGADELLVSAREGYVEDIYTNNLTTSVHLGRVFYRESSTLNKQHSNISLRCQVAYYLLPLDGLGILCSSSMIIM